MYRGLDQDSVRSLLFSGHNVQKSPDRSDVLKQAKAAWQDYGAYEIIPYENGVIGVDRSKLEYLNMFGVKEYATVVEVGSVKYDVEENYYDYPTRNLAIGITNPNNNMPPGRDAAKRAMAALPTLTVLLKLRM
jgi:hypothetical protein